jgi:hypothetical protein
MLAPFGVIGWKNSAAAGSEIVIFLRHWKYKKVTPLIMKIKFICQ